MANMVGFNFRCRSFAPRWVGPSYESSRASTTWRTRNADMCSREMSRILPASACRRASGTATVLQRMCRICSSRSTTRRDGHVARLFVAALREEGVPVGTGYIRPMYANAMFLKKVAFGKTAALGAKTAVSVLVEYHHGQCPDDRATAL